MTMQGDESSAEDRSEAERLQEANTKLKRLALKLKNDLAAAQAEVCSPPFFCPSCFVLVLTRACARIAGLGAQSAGC